MARRRGRGQSSGGEAIAGVIIAAIALVYLSGASTSTIVNYALIALSVLSAIVLAAWFIRGLLESSKPVDSGTRPERKMPMPRNGKASKPAEIKEKLEWTTELIVDLEWRVFEKLCSRIWEEKGFDARETSVGADGGVDFYLYAKQTNQKIGAVQCKSWSKKQIGVNVVREIQGVVVADQLQLGLLMYSGRLSVAAEEFLSNPRVTVKAQGNNEILTEIKKLSLEKQSRLLAEITGGAYKTPSCPNCDVKLVERQAKDSDKVFWGCVNFPRCRFIFN